MASDGLLLTLRVLTFVTALAVGLSPYPEIRRVHKQRDASEVSIFPVVTLFGNSYLWMIYSYLIGNFFPLFSVCAFQTVSAIVFGAVYWWWCTSRGRFYMLWGATVVAMALASVYAAIAVAGVTHQSQHQVEKILGYLCVVMNVCLKVAPLETLKRIIRTKNASSMPVTMSIVAFINGLLWVWTSALQDDMYVLSTNAVGTALGGVQIIVYVIYRPGKIEDAALRPTTGRVDSDHPRPKSEQAIVYALEADTKNERSKSAVFVEVKSPL
uniref:Sugar transporter SWEET1 n=1 Tax=Phytophthora ramorum TaxID=164328 RepID=H3GD98_PHYRM